MDDATAGSWSATTLTVRKSLRERLEEAQRFDDDQQPDAAVATIVAVEGSAYRRPGAKRLIDDDEAIGAITAGCLEGPVAALAERALEDGALVETFDLTDDDDTWSFGLGCNGIIDVLVEPLDQSFTDALERSKVGERVALLTVVGGDHPAAVGARAIAAPDADPEPTGSRPPIPDDILATVTETAREFAAVGRSDTITVETDRGTAAVFVDGFEPIPELLIFGNGADVRPVSRFARDAGFRVTVASARGAKADAQRFPAAHDVLAVHPTEVATAITRPAETYAVLMSHNFVDDRLALDAILDTQVPYIGLMGPRKRFEQMQEALAEEGITLSGEERDRISTPVGLDLGGGEPNQIAISIVAEALALVNDREGGRLTDREGPIHPQPESTRSS